MAEQLPSPVTRSGETIALACNLPHGLTINHRGKELTLNGANHPRALVTVGSISGTWGITRDVDKAWYESWAKESQHSAVKSGNIMVNTANKIEAQAEEMGDAVKTGVDALDPTKPAPGITPADTDNGDDD